MTSDERTIPAARIDWDERVDALVMGAGGAGLTAALSIVADAPDATVLVAEKASEPGGNTSLSTGLIPAAGTRMQAAAGVDDAPERMARDIVEKSDGDAPRALVERLCAESAELVHWFVDAWDVRFEFVEDIRYPGHTAHRMHAVDGGDGATMVGALVDRIESASTVRLSCGASGRSLAVDGDRVVGAVLGDGRAVRADRVVLATDGFAANAAMVERWSDPAAAAAAYHGAPGNTGDGIELGRTLGAAVACMDSYQAHATRVVDTGEISGYGIVLYGGVIVDDRGDRFGDESVGPSDFAVEVLSHPRRTYVIFDRGIHERMLATFDGFRRAVDRSSYATADSVADLAAALGCDVGRTVETVERYNAATREGAADDVGRRSCRAALEPPFYGAEVEGTLMQTQGGLVIDERARVLRDDDSPIEGLYAVGGTAVGLGGRGSKGYLPGNGLLAALGLGRAAGRTAARSIGDR
ncbi:FAD-binding protein [Haloferacaceae archaeon DSL9]